MKAVQINSYGTPDVIEINLSANEPALKENQILVENYAASINPFDLKLLKGYLKENAQLQFPSILGGDFSGKIIKVGSEVRDFKIGDEVYGQAIVLSGASGSMAEIITANMGEFSYKPKTSDFYTAGALPLAGVSVLQALEDHINLQKGQKMLIQGGSGGIGHIAIQLAKTLGAYVATTVSTQNVDFAKSLGADEVIDYTKQDFEEIIHEYDAVFDTVGGETTDKSFKIIRKGGILVTMIGKSNEELAKQYDVIFISQGTKTNINHLDRLAKYIDNADIKVYIDKMFSIDDAKDAFWRQENGSHKGKIIVKIR